MMNIRLIKLCIVYVFCQYGFATCLTIYHLLEKFDTQTLLKHGSFCGIQIFVLINLGFVVFMADDVYKFQKNYRKSMFPIELLNENTLEKIGIMSTITNLLCFLNMFLATVAALGFIAAPEYFNEKTYLSVWIQETFPEYSNYLLFVVQMTSLPVALVMAGTSVAWAYGGANALFQLFILQEMIATISKSTLPQKLRRESRVYQEITKQKMIMSIMAHELAIGFQNMACDLIAAPLMMFSVGSVILGGSLMIEFFSNQEQNLGDQYTIYVGIFCFAGAGAISGFLYLIIGQAMKDESEDCNYQLRQLPWYDMNQENKRMYSIFLYQSQKCLALSNSLLQIDYVLLVRILKSLYSLAAVLAQFVSSNKTAEKS